MFHGNLSGRRRGGRQYDAGPRVSELRAYMREEIVTLGSHGESLRFEAQRTDKVMRRQHGLRA